MDSVKTVGREPTEEMLTAGRDHAVPSTQNIGAIWRAMWDKAASPAGAEVVAGAKEIIANGCGCDRDCERNGEGYCGCLSDAQSVLALAAPLTPSTDAVRREARPADDWRPIETAPHEVNVLLAWRDWSLPGQWRMEAGEASWGWRNEVASRMSRHGEATHWMPLPAPPAGDDEGGKNGG